MAASAAKMDTSTSSTQLANGHHRHHHQKTSSATTALPLPSLSSRTLSPNNNIVLKTLSLFLGFLFIFYGLLKVSSLVSAEMHRELRRSFVKFNKVHPLTQLLGLQIPSRYLRNAVGYSEIVGGLILGLSPWEVVKLAANIYLLVVSLNATVCNCLVEEAFDRQTPALVFTMMLVCRLVVHYQVLKRNAKKGRKADETDETSKSSSSATSIQSLPPLREKAFHKVLRNNGVNPEEFMGRIAKLGLTDVIDSMADELLVQLNQAEGKKTANGRLKME